MTLPTGSTGRLLAMGILLVPFLLLAQFVFVPAWKAYAAEGERIELVRGQLERYQRLSAQLPAMRAQGGQLRDEDLVVPFLVTAPNDALAAAELQERLKAIALAHDGRILSTRVLKGAADGSFERIVVEARLEMTLEGLQDLLLEVETRKPYLFIEELAVMERPRRRGAAPVPTASLDTRLTVYGLRRRAETGGAPRG
jgi:hypothetical protein